VPPRDFYEILGVPRDAGAEDIQRAYRKLARTYHPDVNKDPGAEDRFKEVSEAYDVLSDPDTRRRYDAFGPSFRQVPEGVDPETWAAAQRAGPSRQRAGSNAGAGRRAGPGGFTWTTSGGEDEFFTGFGDVDLDDLLGGFFGRTGRGAGDVRRGPERGADVTAEIPITVEEAFTGTRRRITLSGADGERSLEVTVPAGVVDGQRIRLAGQGGQGEGGGTPGDVYLTVHIQPHPRYRLDGRDITVELPVTPWEAALGAKVPVESPGGEHKVTVPAGSSSGRRLRLKGQGLSNPRGTPGDLYAEVKIMVPKRLSGGERELFEQLGRVSDFDPRRHR
jgi:curved DNA-binding protein